MRQELKKLLRKIFSEEVLNGVKPTAVATKYGVSHMTVRRACKENNVQYDFRRGDNMTDEQLSEVSTSIVNDIVKLFSDRDLLKDNVSYAEKKELTNRVVTVLKPYALKLDQSETVQNLLKEIEALNVAKQKDNSKPV